MKVDVLFSAVRFEFLLRQASQPSPGPGWWPPTAVGGRGVSPDLLSDFEVAFPRMDGARQRVLFRALLRAAGLGRAEAMERLVQDALGWQE